MLFQTFRNARFVKYFWGFMAVYFLNICIDPSDIHHSSIPEDLTYNEQESILEMVAEKVLDLGDVIEEQDDEDPEDYSKKGVSKIEVSFLKEELFSAITYDFSSLVNNFKPHPSIFVEPHYQLEKPPPKV